MDSEKLASIRSANDSRVSGEQTGSDSESVKFDSLDPFRLTLQADLRSLHLAPAPALDCDIRGKKTENFNLKTENSAPKGSDWVYALKDVSFEVKRGELRPWDGPKKRFQRNALVQPRCRTPGGDSINCLESSGGMGPGQLALAVAGKA